MPDLKSELAKLAHAWDDHEETIRTPNQTQPKQENNVTSINTTSITTTTTMPAAPKSSGSPIRNNVMRTCFDAVWQHPGKTAQELAELLTKQGFKATSTTAVFAQLVRTGQAIRGDDRKLHPNPAVKTYRPIKAFPTRAVPKKPNPKKVESKAKGTGIAALKTAATPAATTATVTVAPETKGVSSIIIHRNWTPESVLDKLTLPQAKQLYEALAKYFK